MLNVCEAMVFRGWQEKTTWVDTNWLEQICLSSGFGRDVYMQKDRQCLLLIQPVHNTLVNQKNHCPLVGLYIHTCTNQPKQGLKTTRIVDENQAILGLASNQILTSSFRITLTLQPKNCCEPVCEFPTVDSSQNWVLKVLHLGEVSEGI